VASVGVPAGGTGPARVAVLAGAALVYLAVDALLVAGVMWAVRIRPEPTVAESHAS